MERFRNTLGKGENAGNQYFLFLKMFSILLKTNLKLLRGKKLTKILLAAIHAFHVTVAAFLLKHY